MTAPAVLLGAGLAGMAVYDLGAYATAALAGDLTWHGDREARTIAITFDDGPDPRYTPRCLQILESCNIRASFFLVGERARRHPELAREIRDRGHDIGNHTWSHRYHWLLPPAAAGIEVRQGADAIAEVVGARPRFFRPPYGAMNVASYREARRLGQRCVMWSLPGRDWRRGLTPEMIAGRITRRLRPGAIVLLHDSGGAAGAPAVMLDALPAILEETRRRQLEPVPLSAMLDAPA